MPRVITPNEVYITNPCMELFKKSDKLEMEMIPVKKRLIIK